MVRLGGLGGPLIPMTTTQQNPAVIAYKKYLDDLGPELSPRTKENYVNIIRSVVKMVDPKDLKNPQTIAYLRNGVPDGYRPMFTSAWRSFVFFSRMKGRDLAVAPDGRKTHFVHPMYPDMKRVLSTYYNGLADVRWEKFLQDHANDQKMLIAASRLYRFFTGADAPMGEQPLLPRNGNSMEPMPEFIYDVVLRSRNRQTSRGGEALHESLNDQIADKGMAHTTSAWVYKLFVLGHMALRHKSTGSRMDAEEAWERDIMLEQDHALIQSIASYLNVSLSDPQLGGILYE